MITMYNSSESKTSNERISFYAINNEWKCAFRFSTFSLHAITLAYTAAHCIRITFTQYNFTKRTIETCQLRLKHSNSSPSLTHTNKHTHARTFIDSYGVAIHRHYESNSTMFNAYAHAQPIEISFPFYSHSTI